MKTGVREELIKLGGEEWRDKGRKGGGGGGGRKKDRRGRSRMKTVIFWTGD